MMSVVYHPKAQEEFAAAARYYEVRQSGVGERFRKLILQIESNTSANPETGFIHDFETRKIGRAHV